MASPPDSLHFLFRTEAGEIGRAQWWRGVAILVVPLVLLTAGWLWLEPYANRGLDQRKLIDAATLGTYIYLVIFAFAVIFIAVCFVMLSGKRLRARRRQPALAGALPLAMLITGAAAWLQPRVADVMPRGVVLACDMAAIAIVGWFIWELGTRSD